MERDTCVYYHRRKDTNEVFYVGIGKKNRPYFKWNRNPLWVNIVSKIDYDIEVIHTDLTWDEACEYEKQYIKKFGRRDLGLGKLVNMTDGGDSHPNLSPIVKEKIRQSQLGQNNSMYGKTPWNKGFKNSELSPRYWLGKKRPQETIEKIINNRRSFEGENNPFHNKKHTKESRSKMGNKGEDHNKSVLTEKHILQIRENKDGLTHLELSKKYNVSRPTITNIINRKYWKHI